MPLESMEMSESSLHLVWPVHAPTERVWVALTTAPDIEQRLGTLVSADFSAGSSFTVDHGDGYRCFLTVVDSEPHRALSYT